MSTEADPIVIEEDFEYDGEDIGGPLGIYWTKGHGHDQRKLTEAVVTFCLDEYGGVPSIPEDTPIEELWQRNVEVGDGVYYERSATKPTARSDRAFPVTVLDTSTPRRGGVWGCAVRGCHEPWYCTVPLRVVVAATDAESDNYWSVDMRLCRDHHARLPGDYYRTLVVPVGTTVVLPEDDK